MIFWKFFKEIKVISFFLRTTIGVKTGYNKIPIELEQIDKSITLTSAQKNVFKKVYMFCFVYKNAKGFTTISNSSLSKELGITIKSVKHSLDVLEKYNLIRREIIEPKDLRNRSKTKNRYRLITVIGGIKNIKVLDLRKEVVI